MTMSTLTRSKPRLMERRDDMRLPFATGIWVAQGQKMVEGTTTDLSGNGLSAIFEGGGLEALAVGDEVRIEIFLRGERVAGSAIVTRRNRMGSLGKTAALAMHAKSPDLLRALRSMA